MSKTPSALHSTPRPPLDRRFGYRFAIISRVLAQHTLLYVGREFGLNLAEFRILTELAERESASIKDIAVPTALDKAHVTRALASLVGRGLATQVVDSADRRLRLVKLTAAGRTIIAAAQPFWVERQTRLEKCLTASELRVLWKALAALSDEAARMLAEEAKKGSRRKPATAPSAPISAQKKRKAAG